MKIEVYDRLGNPIYLTDERWMHITEFHQEMMDYKDHLLSTLKKGRRRQDPLDPSLYIYYHPFDDLEKGYNHIVVIVKFDLQETVEGEVPNNFVLTAYQKHFPMK